MSKNREEQNIARFKHIKFTEQPISETGDNLPLGVNLPIERVQRQLQTDPVKAIPVLEEWIKKYPRTGTFYNYLMYAYHTDGRTKEAEALTLLAYEKAPHYLFSKVGYAQYCMKQGHVDKIPEIFENKLDLAELYPKRKVFHKSEVQGFYTLMCQYYAMTKNSEMGWACYDYLKFLTPDDPSLPQLQRALIVGTFPRWKAYLMIAGIILLVIALIVLIIWGLGKLV